MRFKRLMKPPSPSFQGRTPCNTRGGSTRKGCSKFLKKKAPVCRLKVCLGATPILWMVYERVILPVKRTNNESKGRRVEAGWEAGILSLENFPLTPPAFFLCLGR